MSVTRAPPCVAASSIFRTVLIKQQLRCPSRSPVEIRTVREVVRLCPAEADPARAPAGTGITFETDALPTRACPGCL